MLMSMNRALWLVVVLVGGLAGCGATDSDQIVGDGVVAERAVDVINFDRVDVAFVGSVTLEPGDEGAVITGDSNVVDLVTVEVRNRVLVVDLDDSIEPTLPLQVAVTFAELGSVELSGEGELRIEGWRTSQAQLILSGAGNVVADVVAGELLVMYPGAGSVTVTGEVGTQRLDKTGLGPYLAGDLRSDVAELKARGIGEIEVWAELELTYDVTGQGEVRYWGTPTADGQISSQGGLVGLGPKEG